MISQTISHYKILEKLGEGGMGVVYKAQDLKLDRTVALKFLPPILIASQDEATRFEQEAKAISSLNHSNIATIHDVDEGDGQRFLVLEYLPSGTLKSKIKDLYSSGRELSLAQIIDYGLQIAEGLAHAHRRGIVHRDVKTDNMMLTEEIKVKITDFGLAKLRGGAHVTKTGSTVGTAAYMSPEQIRGEEADHRSDLFSLGVVLYELATGHLPFRGEHEAALSYSIVNEDPVTPKTFRPSLPSSLETVIQRCLEKDRQKRYQSADEIAVDLRKTQQELSGPVGIPSKISKVPWIAAALVVLALIAVYVFFPSKSAIVDEKSIAVLPFKNLSGEKENEYFSDGITEDIITQLSKIADLKVISRTSAMRYKNTEKGLREIGTELNVATILEGSVRRAGNRVRIVSQLIDAETHEHIWAESYDRDLSDIFEIQSDVAAQIAAALKAELSPAEKELIEKKPTESVTAYEFYLRGRDYYYRYHKQDNENAIELFKKALELDPSYALAYAGLGDSYGQRVGKFGFSADWLDSAIAVSEKAISIDPQLAEAYKALGLAYDFEGWTHKSLEAYERSVQLNPNYEPAVGNIGFNNLRIGQFDEALRWMRRALSLDPSFAFTSFGIGTIYFRLGDDLRAERWFRRATELQPDFAYGVAALAQLYLYNGNYDQAVQTGKKIISIDAGNLDGLNLLGDAHLFAGNYQQAEQYYRRGIREHSRSMAEVAYRSNKTSLGFLLWMTDKKEEAQRLFDESLKLDREELQHGNEWFAIPYDIAAINAVRGNKNEAYKWLGKATEAGWRDYRLGLIDPLLENLRDDDQFKQMMAEVKATVDEMRARVEGMEEE